MSLAQPQELKVPVTRIYQRNEEALTPFVVNIGGAGSSKSHSIGQLFVRRFMNRSRRKMLVTRKTGPALYLTAYSLIETLFKKYKIYHRILHDKTRSIFHNPSNGSMMAFMSVDDPEKIKSTDWNDVWMEEANEFTWQDFLVFQTRMREASEPGEPNQIFMSLNPGEEQGWINQKLLLSPAFAGRVTAIWSNHWDNPFLSGDYRNTLESLKDQDPDAYNVFGAGTWGQMTNIIYPPYTTILEYPAGYSDEFYGLDFGYNVPSALIRVGILDERNAYLEQLIYKTRLNNSELIDLMKDVIPKGSRKKPLYADAAEPDRIEEIHRAGFNVYPADKSVEDGIDFCKRMKFFATAANVDLNKERAGYKWRSDKNGNVLDEPVKFNDHLMDAKRYAIWTHMKGASSMPSITVF